MRITTKGQVTIPQHVRRAMGLAPHMEIDFVVEDGRAYLRKSQTAPSKGAKLVRSLRGRAHTTMSTDEIMSLTRGD